ncbi:peptide MFS transporter [Piscirickettsia litoralis]|uniref:MFS transporter n=1 Tax=Piscirickettsia litoralis TaxID=1891921 RepID=A0ABX3A4Q3_9GAMM|nr:oligopeptide:H+ symporter [Piscirickettsia litoralis]ODN42623.1 MFS transporter [Piscirickettsia litoralis]
MNQPQQRSKLERILPKGSGSLFFIQVFATLGFAVLYSTLVLYMTDKLKFSAVAAAGIMGSFTAFNYALHLLGGYCGGRLLSNRNLFTIGMLLQVIGCWTLASATASHLYWGLAFFLTGSGLNVTCINMMLTQRYAPEDKARESAFLWNYSGMNIGFMIGFIVAGHFQLTHDYHSLFLLTSLGNAITLVILFFNWQGVADRTTQLKEATRTEFTRRSLAGLTLIIILIPIIKTFLTHSKFSHSLVLIVGSIMVLVIAFLAIRQPNLVSRNKVFAYLIFSLASLIFWVQALLAPMALTIFAEHNVNLHLFGIQIAPQWLLNVNTVVIIIGGPLLTFLFNYLRDKNIHISLATQFACSLLLAGAGIALLPIGIHFASTSGYVSVVWVLLSYGLQSAGELFMGPIGYAMIGQLAPKNLQGVMMGTWMMVSGVAGVLAAQVSALAVGSHTNTTNPLITNPDYSHTFNMLGWASILIGILLLFAVPKIKKSHPRAFGFKSQLK